ncbi:hypothetical protein AZZ66_001491, partial [Escherichia coli]
IKVSCYMYQFNYGWVKFMLIVAEG